MKITLLTLVLLVSGLTAARAQEEEHPFAKSVAAKLTNPKKKFTVIVKAAVKEGEAPKFIAAFKEAIEPTRKEQGCLRYELNQMNGETNTFVVYERWANLERMKAHLATPHTKKLLETVMPLMDGEPSLFVLTPQGDPVKPKTEPDKKAPESPAEKKPEAK